MGRALTDVSIDLCITSEFPRTIQTADLALSGRAVPRVIDACFDDISYGSFEGKPLSEYEQWQQTHPMDMDPPGSDESRVGAIRHYRQGLRRVLARKEHTILLVIHEFPLGVILRAVQGEDPTDHPHRVPYATPHRLSETDVRHASNHLEKWLQGWKPRS
jgi:broad specificity phosphatase PhoE